MKCLYCGTDILEEWTCCGECGVNIEEYEKADKFIKKGLEFENQFEYAKASKEYKCALELSVPQDKIFEHLERVALKEQTIIDKINEGEEAFIAHKWGNVIRLYEDALKLDPRLAEELNPKLIEAKNMLRKFRKKIGILWTIFGAIVAIGIIAWYAYMGTPEQIARKTLRECILSTDVQEKIIAIEALGGLKDKKFLPLLKDALKDNDSGVRSAAAKSLGRIEDSSSISILKESLFDRSWKVRIEAAHSLVLLGDSSGVQLLRDAIRRE